MEVIYPVSKKKAIHPIAIFKEGLGLWAKNLLCRGGIYLVAQLPFIGLGIWVASLRPGSDIFDLPMLFLGWFFSAWGVVAVTMAVDKQGGADKGNKIWENIIGARKRFLPYLGTTILCDLLLLLITIIALISFIVISVFGNAYNSVTKNFPYEIITNVLLCFLLPALVFVLLYFAIRLSLGGIISVVDDTAGPLTALRRSHALIKKYVTSVVGVYALLGVVSILFYLAVLALLSLAGIEIKIQVGYKGAGFWGIILINLFFIILTPLWTSIKVELYKKLKEAVDV